MRIVAVGQKIIKTRIVRTSVRLDDHVGNVEWDANMLLMGHTLGVFDRSVILTNQID